MKVGVVRPVVEGETRVALIPESVSKLKKAGYEIVIETGAGDLASFRQEDYTSAGASVAPSASCVFEQADIVVLVHPPTDSQIAEMRSGCIVMAPLSALTNTSLVAKLAEAGVTALALELMPRITRAQSMDILSSMSNLAGYKAVLLAASRLGRIFPMMMTAAGTLTPAKVLVIGAGVAGLQAIATARRLGAVVEAFDVRPVVKEQVESLGARFVVVDAPTEDAQDQGGYAKEMSAAYQARQKEVIAEHVRDNDVVITTALIPGKPAPRLITAEMVAAMKPGSVIVDLAAEAGGNCELTRCGETVELHQVTILGPKNLPAQLPFHASQMYSRNITTLILELGKKGQVTLDPANEIVAGILVTKDGQVVHPRVREMMPASPAGAAC